MITKYPRQEASQNQKNTETVNTKDARNDEKLCNELKEHGKCERKKDKKGEKGGTGTITCELGGVYDSSKNECVCANGITTDGTNQCIYNAYGTMGIQCSPEQMKTGSCSRNINQTLGLDKSRPNPTVFVQDLILAATSFVGTVMVIALIVMGWKYIQGGFDESSSGDLKKNIMKLLIGLGLIVGSYTIIRVIQYIAMGM